MGPPGKSGRRVSIKQPAICINLLVLSFCFFKFLTSEEELITQRWLSLSCGVSSEGRALSFISFVPPEVEDRFYQHRGSFWYWVNECFPKRALEQPTLSIFKVVNVSCLQYHLKSCSPSAANRVALALMVLGECLERLELRYSSFSLLSFL